MNETRATLLALIVGLAVMSAAFVTLVSVDASVEVLFLAFILPLIATSYVNSLIVMHYGESARRRRR